MGLFAKRTGKYKKVERRRLTRSRRLLETRVKQVQTLPVDQWATVLAQIYSQGAVRGIHDGVTRYTADYRVMDTQDDWQGQRYEREIWHQLVTFLNEADSIEFLAMDRAISGTVQRRNHVENFEALQRLDHPTITVNDVEQIFLAGWLLGEQNFEYQVLKHEVTTSEDAWLYRKAEHRAQKNAEQLNYTGFTNVRTQRYFTSQILTVLEKTSQWP